MKTYEYAQLGLENLKQAERPMPEPGAHEVVVRIHAVSLNYRDLLFAWGLYNPHPNLPAVPCSDAAGEVVAVGAEVTKWKAGDKVCPIFMQGWLAGTLKAQYGQTALGGGHIDGVLREYAAFHEDGLVAMPAHLSYEEAACLPCAAVTAWNALVEVAQIKAGQTVLTLGTGGVSMFALQLAKASGARVISTSSSDEKLERARALGADETINYKQNPEWQKEVLKLTGGAGVDVVVEVGGAGTIRRSVDATRTGGTLGVIGVLAQGEGIDPIKVLMKGLRLQGIFVGSRAMFEDLNRAISLHQLKPVIDRVFEFGDAVKALRHMESGAHFGKIVVRV